ncbi:hypothetical protein P692DRAFT_20815706 [Suillus brevipes Sb2]|nr:hypothetical protein P692DRAFT_20815706 [Suillus brevipes Sb2]
MAIGADERWPLYTVDRDVVAASTCMGNTEKIAKKITTFLRRVVALGPGPSEAILAFKPVMPKFEYIATDTVTAHGHPGNSMLHLELGQNHRKSKTPRGPDTATSERPLINRIPENTVTRSYFRQDSSKRRVILFIERWLARPYKAAISVSNGASVFANDFVYRCTILNIHTIHTKSDATTVFDNANRKRALTSITHHSLTRNPLKCFPSNLQVLLLDISTACKDTHLETLVASTQWVMPKFET